MNFIGMGPFEIMIIMAVALIAFGPNRLPELARHLAKAFKMFKDAGREIQNQLDQVDWEIKQQQQTKKHKKTPAISYDDTPDEDYDFESEYNYDYEAKNKDKSYPEPNEGHSDETTASTMSHSGNGTQVDESESQPVNQTTSTDPAKVNDAQRYSREMGD